MLKSNPNKSIILWLLSGCFIIYIMVVVGCLTRLTHSGLSITEWGVIGTLPPLSPEKWDDAFSKYQQSPEFKNVNYDMTIDQFKSIFWWEWTHRFIGRTILSGVFLIGFVYFFVRKKLTPSLKKKFIFLFILGALQGVIGGWMVASGLNKVPAVSHYRLALHLMSAFMVFAFTFWYALELLNETEEKPEANTSKIRPILISFFVVLLLQITYGAFTAGYVEMSPENKPLNRPGHMFTSWPKMGDSWIPEQVTMKEGFFANILENPAGIQFVHRTMAFLVVAFVAFIWIKTNKMKLNKSQYRGVTFLIYGITIQFMLGVYTLLYQVPILLGALHQTGAFFLFATTIYLLFHFRKTKI